MKEKHIKKRKLQKQEKLKEADVKLQSKPINSLIALKPIGLDELKDIHK
jgi:hypothetical protein